jgi:polar amino acid transport system permease protein
MAITEAARPAILGEIERANRRSRRSFLIKVAAVWAVILAGLVAVVALMGDFEGDWVARWAPFIVGGVGITILVSLASIALAIVLAIFGALGRLSTHPIAYGLAALYVSLVRGTPLIVQIFFIYFALPRVGIILPAVPAGILALGFNYGAYLTEIFRAGIQAVPRGQREAAEALAMPESSIQRRIVLPQATRIVIPAIGNEFIAMLKDSALVSFLGVQEVFWRAETAGRPTLHSLEAFAIAALIYWALTMAFSFSQERLERRMARGDR